MLLNYRSGADLPACLGGLLAQDFTDFEVLLVDQGQEDGSTDDALRVFSDAFGTRLRPIRAGKNLGTAGGFNLALRHARGRWLALLDTDAVPDPPWLGALVRAGEAGEGVGMCASRIRLLTAPGRLENAGHGLYADGLVVPRGRGAADGARWSVPGEVLCPSGAAGLYRLEAVRGVGGFAEGFFSHGEDLDMGLSLRARGWRCLYVPEATVRHHLSGTWGRRSLRKAYLTERNRVWIAVRHFPRPALMALPAYTVWRWTLSVRAGLLGDGPLGPLFTDARGVTSLDDPPMGRLRGTGVQAGAVTRLALLGGAVLAAQAAATLGLPGQLRSRRQLDEIQAMGAEGLPELLTRFGASAQEAAARWLDGTLTPEGEGARPPNEFGPAGGEGA